jgi:biotin-dependent carboxylase-like uncharacterized protein
LIRPPATVTILRPGSLSTLQDGGRPGLAHLAVPRSGPADRQAARLANRLVGNRETAACIETTFDGVTVTVGAACAVAVTGALAPVAVDSRPAGWAVPILLRGGQTLDIGTATHGIRCYVAVSGGITAAQVMGSVSTDLLSGLGPPPLALGQVLPLGSPTGAPSTLDFAPYPTPPAELRLSLHLGPRHDWVAAEGLRALTTCAYRVTPASNRIAVRLEGQPVTQSRGDELPSEGVVEGSVQIPPDGQPLIFLADHPTTAGYPIVGVIAPRLVGQCAQARPGITVTFSLAKASDPRQGVKQMG